MNKKLQDLAWSILPKEFKEEVKNYYEHTDSCSREEDVLESIFGEHNLLTSDAEGEVELLHVTRQKVMGLYANAKKIHDLYTSATCINTKESQQIDICKGVMSILDTLFGSKCLPDGNKECSNPSVVNCKHKHGDGTCSLSGMCCYKSPKPAEPEEKDDCKKFTKRLDDTLEGDIKEPFKEWRDKNSSNVEKLEKNGEVEPKPAEPKYHIGQYVRHKPTRLVDVIEGISQSAPYIYHFKHMVNPINGQGIFESDLEPCTEPREEVSKMKPIESKVSVYLATEEENEEFRQFLHNNGFTWSTGASLTSQSVWLPDEEETKIHNIYPDKTVTYSGYRTPNFLTFSEFKKQYFEENANLSQETPNCDKHFDNILKDSFSKERRLNIAKDFASVLLSRLNYDPFTAQINCCCSGGAAVNPYLNIARIALSVADALIAESEKGGEK